MSRTTTRVATAEDLDVLADLFGKQLEHQRQLSPYFQRDAESDCAAFLAGRIGSANAAIFLAEHDAAVAGYIIVRIVGQQPAARQSGWRAWRRRVLGFPAKPAVALFEPRRRGFIEDWYVLPELRHHGIGMALWNAGLDWFRRQAVHELEATVLAPNESARQLFGQLGFVPTRILLHKRLE